MILAEYLRKSRSDDPGTSVADTLRRHKEELDKYAAENGHTIVKVYEEVVSGDSLYSRPQMLQLLEDIEKGMYEAVLCMDLDRLGRGGMSDQGTILETFKESGTLIVTPRKIYDLSDDMDEELTEFQTFMARRELKMIKRRLQRGIRKTIEEGGYIANAPFGYEKTYINKRPTLEIKEDEAVYIRMIYDMYINQGMGCQTIAAALNSLGVKPRRSDSFGRTSIATILKNPTYCGKVVWDQKHRVKKGVKGNIRHITVYNPREEWTVADGIHSAIIDEDTWNKAQEILKGRYHSPYFNGVVKNPLAGIVYCSACGKLMQRRPYTWKKGPEQLICETIGCCCSSNLPFVETAVFDAVRTELRALCDDRSKSVHRAEQDYTPAIHAANKELSVLKGQRDKLHDFLEQGIYDAEVFLERMGVLNGKIAETELTISNLSNRRSFIRVIDYDTTIKRISDALEAYEKADAPEKNKLLRSVLEKAAYYKEKGWEPGQFIISVSIKPEYK